MAFKNLKILEKEQLNDLLIYYAERGMFSHVVRMFGQGADINTENLSTGETALICATRGNHPKMVKWLIDNGADINHQNQQGGTALYHAANYDLLECLNILLSAKPNLDIQDNEGDTALHAAARFGFDETGLALLKAGAKMDITNKHGYTAFTLAQSLRNRVTELFETWQAQQELNNIVDVQPQEINTL